MRVLRFVALIVILALAYFAQYIFDYLSLAYFFPDWAFASSSRISTIHPLARQ